MQCSCENGKVWSESALWGAPKGKGATDGILRALQTSAGTACTSVATSQKKQLRPQQTQKQRAVAMGTDVRRMTVVQDSTNPRGLNHPGWKAACACTCAWEREQQQGGRAQELFQWKQQGCKPRPSEEVVTSIFRKKRLHQQHKGDSLNDPALMFPTRGNSGNLNIHKICSGRFTFPL